MGLFDSLKKVFATLVAIVHSRLELLGIEIQEEFARFGQLLFLAAAAVLVGALAVAFVGIALIVAFWDDHRVLVASLVALVMVLAAMVLGLRLRAAIVHKPAPFSSLLTELAKDHKELSTPGVHPGTER